MRWTEELAAPTFAAAGGSGREIAPALSAAPASVAELRAAVRALPAVVHAARVREGEPLALSFGGSLDVEMRSGSQGVELALRPEPRLARAAESELPALVAALRARGIPVASAAVRPRSGTPPRRQAR